jgi:hypothetical protein
LIPLEQISETNKLDEFNGSGEPPPATDSSNSHTNLNTELWRYNRHWQYTYHFPIPFPQAGLRIRIHFIRIRIQHFRLIIDPYPDPIWIRIQSGSRALMTNKWKKITAEKNVIIFWIKSYNLPIPGPP